MGYNTDFWGGWSITPTLTKDHRLYLAKFSNSRRVQRDPDKLPSDHLAIRLGLGHGLEGGYYVEDSNISITNDNRPPEGQPGLWCDWVPSEDGTEIVWDEAEKFFFCVDWIRYLMTHFLIPWGYTLNGSIDAQGEDRDDRYRIDIENNELSIVTFKEVVDTRTVLIRRSL